MRILQGLASFVVDFLIGDEPKIALGVVLALAAGAMAVLGGAPAAIVTIGVGLALAAGFVVVVLIEVRSG